MDIFFHDPDDVPLKPEDVRIRTLEAKPWPDGKRVAVRFEITPFLQRPNIEVKIFNSNQEEVAELNVVEVLELKMDFTMHIREPNPEGTFKISMRIHYSDLERFDKEGSTEYSSGEILKKADITVDESEIIFIISNSDHATKQ